MSQVRQPQLRLIYGNLADKLILDPKEKVGATISDIAPMLVPFGAEEKAAVAGGEAVIAGEEAGAQAAEHSVLAIPGSEESTAVMAWVGDDLVGQPFENADEAKTVRENLKDENWVKDNCRVCGPSVPSTVSTARRTKRRRSSRLARRGNVMGACCRVPQTLDPLDTKFRRCTRRSRRLVCRSRHRANRRSP